MQRWYVMIVASLALGLAVVTEDPKWSKSRAQ